MRKIKIMLILLIIFSVITFNTRVDAVSCIYGEGVRYVAIGRPVNHYQKFYVYKGCKSADGKVYGGTYFGWTLRYVKY